MVVKGNICSGIFDLVKYTCLSTMFEDLDFNIDARIGDFESVDALLNTLNSFVDQSQQVWSGITNEAPHQRLVEKLKHLEAIRIVIAILPSVPKLISWLLMFFLLGMLEVLMRNGLMLSAQSWRALISWIVS